MHNPNKSHHRTRTEPATRLCTLVPLLAIALGGCGDAAHETDTAETTIGDPTEITFASDLGVDVPSMERAPSGLYIRDLEVGSGQEAVPGSQAAVHYTGWLPDGQEFDSSRNGQPFEFMIGAGQVIPGWEEGVEGMRVGGRRQLVIPPSLAYGESGAGGVIPPGATLVFEVELLDVN